MDIQTIIDQVVQTVTNAPEKINDISADPRAAIEDITGQTLGEGDLTQIVGRGQGPCALRRHRPLGHRPFSDRPLQARRHHEPPRCGSGSSPLGGIMGGIGSLFGKK